MTEEIHMPMSDRQFNQSIAKQRMSSGMSAEFLTVADCYERGYSVSKPLDSNSKYDLIVDRHGELLRVQVKSAAKRQLQARIGWTTYREDIYDGGGSKPHFIQKYVAGDFDYLAIVDRVSKMVYYVPIGDLDLSKDSFTVKQVEREKYLAF
jgi:PD-(D/E)XK endonuclease